MSSDQIVRSFYALINGEVDGHATWRDTVHDGWVARPAFPAVPDQVTGYAAAIAMLRRGFPDLRFDLGEVIARDDLFAVRSSVTGTHRGELMGVAATGTPVKFTAIDIHRVEHDRIAETWHVEDFARMLAQLRH
jgi:predicted ester cyclase